MLRLPTMDLKGANFSWPLNFFACALELEEGSIKYLHYGFYDDEDQSVHEAQQNSTDLIMSHFPDPPARVLEVGVGLGTTGRLLRDSGYSYVGITPDAAQIDLCSESGVDLRETMYEDVRPGNNKFDVILFQESAQYIRTETILEQANRLLNPGGIVIIADEVPASLVQSLGELAPTHGFEVEKVTDVTRRAMPSFRYLLRVLKKHFEALVSGLTLDEGQAQNMVTYLENRLGEYESGAYTYSVIKLRKS